MQNSSKTEMWKVQVIGDATFRHVVRLPPFLFSCFSIDFLLGRAMDLVVLLLVAKFISARMLL